MTELIHISWSLCS